MASKGWWCRGSHTCIISGLRKERIVPEGHWGRPLSSDVATLVTTKPAKRHIPWARYEIGGGVHQTRKCQTVSGPPICGPGARSWEGTNIKPTSTIRPVSFLYLRNSVKQEVWIWCGRSCKQEDGATGVDRGFERAAHHQPWALHHASNPVRHTSPGPFVDPPPTLDPPLTLSPPPLEPATPPSHQP